MQFDDVDDGPKRSFRSRPHGISQITKFAGTFLTSHLANVSLEVTLFVTAMLRFLRPKFHFSKPHKSPIRRVLRAKNPPRAASKVLLAIQSRWDPLLTFCPSRWLTGAERCGRGRPEFSKVTRPTLAGLVFCKRIHIIILSNFFTALTR